MKSRDMRLRRNGILWITIDSFCPKFQLQHDFSESRARAWGRWAGLTGALGEGCNVYRRQIGVAVAIRCYAAPVGGPHRAAS